MVCFPQVQIKAQAELDRIVNGRLPDFHDMNALPICPQLSKRFLGWLVASQKENAHKSYHLADPFNLTNNSVLGIPHRSTEDDVYEGYHIPKESIVIFNSWYEPNF